MSRFIVLIAALLFSTIATAGDYLVSLEASDEGELIASPSLLVSEGREASITVGNQLEASLVVDGLPDNAAAVQMALSMDGEVHHPKLLVKLGEESAVSIGAVRVSLKINRVDS